MSDNPISQDDPRLTAYALGEMEPAEREEFEKLLQASPDARRQVEEIRATTHALGHALAGEPLPNAVIPHPAHERLPKVVSFPYYWVAGLAAACFAVGFVIWQSQYVGKETFVYTKVELSGDTGAANSVPQAKGEPALALNLPAADSDTAESRLGDSNRPVLKLGDADDSRPRSEVVSRAPVGIDMNTESSGRAAAVAADVLSTQPVDIRTGAAEDASATIARANETFANAAPITSTVETAVLEPFLYSAPAGKKREDRRSSRAIGAVALGSGARPEAEREPAVGVSLRDGYNNVFKRRERPHNAETYDRVVDNAFVAVAHHPLSTFSIDVDTASYSNMRRFLNGGQRPPPDAVRIEELVNYFVYDYAPPVAKDVPFAASMEVASAPWKPEHRLVRIGLKGREVSPAERGQANLVFLVDVSGSMQDENKLPLVKQSLRLLVDKLQRDDRVALAVYAGNAGLVLPSTAVSRKDEILEAIDRLEAGGSTNGAMGIQLAYDVAKANFVKGGVNRVVLCTDGDFNVGVTNQGELTRLIEEKAKSGVFLTALGFGMGNFKDSTLEKLAGKGNGNYGYVDSLREARKLLVDQAGGTLVTIAKDVKIQVEFNPAEVQAYRLIGYENRLLQKEDFNNDKIDAGEIGAGHTVTALYELVPAGVEWKPEAEVDALKYQRVEGSGAKPRGVAAVSSELLTLKLRYKAPDGDRSRLLEFPLVDAGAGFVDASADFRFAAAVASFGMILRDSPYRGTATLAEVSNWASYGAGRDPGGYRSEFLGLVDTAKQLMQ